MGDDTRRKFQHAVQLFSQGNHAHAEKLVLSLLEVHPDSPDILNLLAVIQNRLGNLDGAIAATERAIQLQPSQPFYHVNLGEMYRRRGDIERSIACARHALSLDPNFQGAHYNLANALKADGRYTEAEASYRRALELRPDDHQSYQNLGNLYRETDRLSEAAATYLAGWRVAPEKVELTYSLAQAHLDLKNEYQAEFFFKDLLGRAPDHALSLKSLAVLLQNQGRQEEGLAYYRRYIAATPSTPDVDAAKRLHLETAAPAFSLSQQEIDRARCRLSERIAFHERSRVQFDAQTLVDENLQAPSQLIYHGQDNRALKERYARLFVSSFPLNPTQHSENRIKIGFLVTRGHEGIFAKYMSGLLNDLDPEQFEPWVICEEQGWKRRIAPKIRQSGVRALWIQSNAFTAAAERIRDLGLDILYHWEIGTDATNYFMAFLRLAPVQVTGAGWPDTSGIPTIDYFISSRWTEPSNADEHYSERLIRFDRLSLHHERPALAGAPASLESMGLERRGRNLYFCAQNLRKLHPDQDALIGEILRRDPNGLAVFVQHETEGVTQQFRLRIAITQADVADRVVVLRRLNYQEYLSVLHHANVVLDSLYFGGANTAYEAFAMCRPLVTLPGTHARGRYASGCYAAMGIEGCVASDSDSYATIAVRLATNLSFRASIVNLLEEKSHVLFSDPGLLQEYASFFKRVARSIEREAGVSSS